MRQNEVQHPASNPRADAVTKHRASKEELHATTGKDGDFPSKTRSSETISGALVKGHQTMLPFFFFVKEQSNTQVDFRAPRGQFVLCGQHLNRFPSPAEFEQACSLTLNKKSIAWVKGQSFIQNNTVSQKRKKKRRMRKAHRASLAQELRGFADLAVLDQTYHPERKHYNRLNGHA